MLSKHPRIQKKLIVQIEFNFCMAVTQFYLLRLLVSLRRVLISANTYPLKQTKQTLSMWQNRCFFPAHVNLARKSLSCISREVFTRDEQARMICVLFLLFYQHYGIWKLLFRTETFLKLNNESLKQKHRRLKTRKRNGEAWGVQK